MSKPRSSKRARIFAPDGQPHVLGIDDGPFSKKQSAPVPIVAVLMQGAASVEGVAVTSFPVDGAGATEHLAQWIGGMRWHPMLHAIVVGGVTIAGLGLIDLERLSKELRVPVLSVTRRDTSANEVGRALIAAGLSERLALLERMPAARRVEHGLYVACAGAEIEFATGILRATRRRAQLPEALRVAHLIGAALVRGASKGRV